MRIHRRNLQMLRCNRIADLTRLLHASRLDQGTTVVHGLQNDLSTRHGGQEPLHGRQNTLDVMRIRAEQNTLRQFIVFGL